MTNVYIVPSEAQDSLHSVSVIPRNTDNGGLIYCDVDIKTKQNSRILLSFWIVCDPKNEFILKMKEIPYPPEDVIVITDSNSEWASIAKNSVLNILRLNREQLNHEYQAWKALSTLLENVKDESNKSQFYFLKEIISRIIRLQAPNYVNPQNVRTLFCAPYIGIKVSQEVMIPWDYLGNCVQTVTLALELHYNATSSTIEIKNETQPKDQKPIGLNQSFINVNQFLSLLKKYSWHIAYKSQML